MSKTSIRERNKAIRLAWEIEQQLVQEGKGTRDWTEEQQKDILDPDKGKAYDENGRAFEGQHMKSVMEYPEYQGDPGNIQFLTREEHLEAHKGSWQNPTNWYYNPETKEFIDFGENKYVPCQIIDLTDPVIKVIEALQMSQETTEASQKGDKENNLGNEQERDTPSSIDSRLSVPHEAKAPQKHSKSIREKIMDAVEAVKGFGERHPVLTVVLKFVGAVAIAAGTNAIANSGKKSGSGSKSYSSDDYFSSSSDSDDPFDLNDYEDTASGIDYPNERCSPKEHMVSAHVQHYHTKNGVICKEKEPYQRGGKHENDWG